MQIIPAVIGETFPEVKEKIEKVKDAVEWVQIDVADGVFAGPQTWGTRIGQTHDLWEPLEMPKIEMHLMLLRPFVPLKEWISSSVDRILLHHESEGNKFDMIEAVKNHGIEAGIVLNLQTPISEADPYIKIVDVVQLMSIARIGHYGEPFDSRVLEKISSLKNRYPDIKIQVDGGITLESARAVKKAGAARVVVGSALWNTTNTVSAIKEFQSL